MNQLTKEWFEVTAKVVGILGGIISAIALVVTLQSGIEQRARELRWKQANLAMELVDTMLSDLQAFDALRMIDWSERTYQLKKDEEEIIGTDDVRHSLDVRNNFNLSPSGVFIRESFDRLFYHMGRMERSVRTELIKFDDVRSPLGYYIQILCNEYKAVILPYMAQLRVYDAQNLLNRFQIDECASTSEVMPEVAAPVEDGSLISVITRQTGIDREDVEYAIEEFLKHIKQRVANGEQVRLKNFGRFSVKERAARSGSNPQTGEPIQIPSKSVPYFKPEKVLTDALSNRADVEVKFPTDESLGDAIAEETGIGRGDVQIILELFLKNIQQRLANGENVSLPYFGTFTVREKATRTGRNPGTGAAIRIPSRKKMGFKSGKAFRDAVNAGVSTNTRVTVPTWKDENEPDHSERGDSVSRKVSPSVDCEKKTDGSVMERVKEIIVEQLGVDGNLVTSSKSFVDDLGADSLDKVELVMAMEEEFNIVIPDDDVSKIFTVKDSVSYINKSLCKP